MQYACDRAFPLPLELARMNGETLLKWESRLKAEALWPQVATWRRSHRFHVNQLRHTSATELRREFGLETAAIVLGHASAQITDAVYAERDRAKVIEVVRKIG